MKPVQIFILANTEKEYEECLAKFKKLEPKWGQHDICHYVAGSVGELSDDSRAFCFVDGRQVSIELMEAGHDVSFI